MPSVCVHVLASVLLWNCGGELWTSRENRGLLTQVVRLPIPDDATLAKSRFAALQYEGNKVPYVARSFSAGGNALMP